MTTKEQKTVVGLYVTSLLMTTDDTMEKYNDKKLVEEWKWAYVCLPDEPLMTGCGNPIGPVVATHSLIKIPISKDQDIKIKNIKIKYQAVTAHPPIP